MTLKMAAAFGIAICALTACGGNSKDDTAKSVAATMTSIAPQPFGDVGEAEIEIDRATAALEPCQVATQAFDVACTTAISEAVDIIDQVDQRLNVRYVTTRTEIQKEIAELEYWRDVCPSTTAGSQERRNCIPFMIAPAEFTAIKFALHEDGRRAGME